MMAIDAKPPIHSSPSPYNEENNPSEVLIETLSINDAK